jgi:putative spermidine/putrescine transport system ATP-binding protein
MQVELKGLQRRIGITFIYVTHDQGEALSMSDRVAVFHHGKVEQVDRPRELYARPRTTFVAGFVGTANVLVGEVAAAILGGAGRGRAVSIRPEHITFGPRGPGQLGLAGRVVEIQFHGATSRFEVEAAGTMLAVTLANLGGDDRRPAIGDAVELVWSPDAMVELEATTGEGGRGGAPP